MSDEEQENLLILAGMAMKNLFWLGWPGYEKQAMSWPRWMPNDDEDYDEENLEIPGAVKKAQALMAYDVIYRGLQKRTSPSAGPGTDAIKGVSLFGDISLSFGDKLDVPLKDGFSLTGLLRAGHPEIYLLLSPYVTEIGFIGDWSEQTPELLDEVAPTT